VNKIVFRDLDGGLLDPETYSCQMAEPGIRMLREIGHPLVLCSSKTRAELEYWRGQLRLDTPFIVENGGAIYIPRNYFPFRPEDSKPRDGYDVIELGTPYRELVQSLERASVMSKCRTIGFHQMSVAEICVRTLLPVRHAEFAKKREYDEPFEILGSCAHRLLSAIRTLGKNCVQRDRFYHIFGSNEKPAAIRLLTTLYTRAHCEMAQAHVVATSKGPRAWNEAIQDLATAETAVTVN
jgi:mannosyl-3-phosphoglycerate phosphatase